MVYRRVLAMFVGAFIAVGPFCAATAFAQSVASPTSTTQAASVSGVASDNNGTPLSGVSVTLSGPATKSMTTGATGAYAFAGVPAGVYALSASKSGYQSASASDIALLAGQAAKLDVSLVSQTLSSLRVIGAVRTTARSGFNVSGLAVTTLSGDAIANREQPNLTGLVEELPGVTVTRDSGSRTPNTSIAVRGASLETKVLIDGHPVSSGVFGTYNTNYANPQIFQQVEVLKGAGLNGPNAGESAGIVNYRTRDFSAKNEFALTLGKDTFGSGNYAGSFNVNLLKGRLSVLGVRTFNSVNGPDNGYSPYQIGTATLTAPGTPALEQWRGDFSDPYATQANLLKIRYKLSPATSLTGEYLGLFGKYVPQGGSYGFVYGSFPLGACANVSTAGKAAVTTNPAQCTNLSIYNAPYSTDTAGQTFNGYGFFPNSTIANNEPSFSFELKTQLKNDTLLLRPYSAIITRFIDGDLENTTPGYGSSAGQAASKYNGLTGWFQVTNPANCQVAFAFDNTNAANTKGPCFTAADNYGAAYVGNTSTQFPTVFKTTGTTPNCSPVTPCWTTPTNQQANGYYGFNTPFSQPEVDRLRGATLSYLHPVHENLYTFSFDYNTDDTLKFTSDTSALPAGCVGVVGSGSPNVPASPYYQPACQVNGLIIPTLPRSSLQIPPTQNIRYDTSVTGLFQLRPNLQLGLGGYYTFQRIYYKITDPTAISAALAAGYAGGEPADATLISGINANSHVDPHVQLEYRATRDLSLRASAGSSVTLPYNGLVSGLTALSVNGGPDGKSDVLTTKNPSLRPETTVAYDLGFDYRTPAGVFSVDGFNNTIHNVFITSTQVIANLAGRSPSQTLLNATFNGPLERSYGIEASLQRNVTSGFGYHLTATAMRAYYDQIPLSFYQGLCKAGATVCSASALVNGKQLDGTGGFTGQIPYFKANGELDYTSASHRWNAAFGDSLYGNNNATGGPAYNVAYGYFGTTLGRGDLNSGLRLSLSAQNIFNSDTAGTFLGSVAAFKGFNPLGVAYSTATGGLVNTNAYSSPNGIMVMQPATFYLELTKKLGF